jgi:hypothetical protein
MGCGVFALGLASFMLSGLYSRFLADDYCKAAHFILYGFWNGQVVAWHILAGRFMVTFLTGVFDYFGTFFYRLTPALVICLWVVELSVLLLRLQRFLPFKLPAAGAWLCGMLVTLSSMVGAPSRLQSLYWRDGMFNYNFPILFFLLLLIIAASQLEKQRQTLARPSSDPRQTLVRVRKPQGSEASGFGSLRVSKRQPLASPSSDLRQTFVRFRKPQGVDAPELAVVVFCRRVRISGIFRRRLQ